MEESNPELESFRQRWKEEVSAKSRTEENKQANAGPSRAARIPQITPRLASDQITHPAEDEHGPQPRATSHNLDTFSGPGLEFGESSSSKTGSREPRTALEYYEKAVERETQGSLGDSLGLYRKAFKLDDAVDQKYKQKHFPPSYFASKLAKTNPSNASATVPSTAHHSLNGPPQSTQDLIAGFSNLAIEPAPPEVEGDPAPSCPVASLPDEILVGIMKEVALHDVTSFVRLAQVCKRMAYLVATEEHIWKRVCVGSEVGFGAMHYEWQTEITGGPLQDDTQDPLDLLEQESTPVIQANPLSLEAIGESLLHNAYYSSWLKMFRLRPRIRFNGCYISYVNYMRPGMAGPSQVSWNSPVHIVTYYRYLRFFRDGTVISLQSTNEPTEVVHHLTKELLETHKSGAMAHLPSVVMQNALRGRWRLSTATDNLEGDLKDAEGDVLVDTEAPIPKYIFRMELSLRSAGKGAKNNKLAWKGFWYYNKQTDDLEEFTLRNDRAFIWSRVKSYGDGA